MTYQGSNYIKKTSSVKSKNKAMDPEKNQVREHNNLKINFKR